jgi:hypothetical protein
MRCSAGPEWPTDLPEPHWYRVPMAPCASAQATDEERAYCGVLAKEPPRLDGGWRTALEGLFGGIDPARDRYAVVR